MTPPIVLRLREAAAAMRQERVSMQATAQAHGPEAQGALLMLAAWVWGSEWILGWFSK